MIRTRFAPSPTGLLHIGGLRTALYAYALAKHGNGEFLLRIEDTDQKREVAGARDQIYSILTTFGLQWDHKPEIQSERVKSGIYQQAADKLVELGFAYVHEGAVRLKVPKDERISFHDFILDKEIAWNSNDVPEAVLLKSDGFPTYHLAVVVDDTDMGISHVIRSAEWLPSTPIHVLVYKYLGYHLPQFGHPTAILDPQGGKLSKRKGNVSCEQFLAEGYLPEALLNFVMLLGWAPKDNRELFTLTEFVEHFNVNGFQKSNPVFNTQKLNWFNGYYLRAKSDPELLALIKPFVTYEATDDLLLKIIPLVKERITTLKEFSPLTEFFVNRPASQATNSDHLQLAKAILSAAQWTKEGIEGPLVAAVKASGWKVGDFFMSLRLAICGNKVTPPLTESMLILGREEVISRLKTID